MNPQHRSNLMMALVFFGSFAYYLFSSPPALAPYRDMGEMVSVSHTLGVAHPPGYPTYTLIGKCFSLLPISNSSYRVNLASVFGGALSCMLFFILLKKFNMDPEVRILAVLFWLAATGFWTISIVTEMYSLNIAAALLLLVVWSDQKDVLKPKMIYLAAFLSALFLGIRLDLVLMGPAFLLAIVLYYKRPSLRNRLIPIFSISALFFVLGFTNYLYLMIRSRQMPLFNWYRPETFERLWSSLIRKSHGGTLDLLSIHYESGELFFTDFWIYIVDSAGQFFWVGLPLACWGLTFLYKTHRHVFIFTVTAWCFSGPFFIYKANMPPNPHALSVLEAHFNLPNVFMMIWIAFGIHSAYTLFLHSNRTSVNMRNGFTSLFSILLVAGILNRWNIVSKRDNYYGVDYGKNIFKTLPADSILIMKKDVQLFIFWALQYAEKVRKDVSVVARGLSGSRWYIQMKSDENFPVQLGPLKSESDFNQFAMANSGKRTFIGWDSDLPVSSLYKLVPTGLVRELRSGQSVTPEDRNQIPDFLRKFYIYRGHYQYPLSNEFFSSDLIDDYQKAHFSLGVNYSNSGNLDLSRKEFNRSIILNSDNANAYYRRAFTFFSQNQMQKAVRDFKTAEVLYELTYDKTREYHSLPDVKVGVRSEWMDALLNLGVALEKMGDVEQSEAAYLKALKIQPELYKAHYNIAVLHWNDDWKKVIFHLENALRIRPDYREAKQFLLKAKYALNQSEKTQ